MLKRNKIFKHTGKWPLALLIGSLLVGCGDGGGTENILCGGNCDPDSDPQTAETGVVGPSETPPGGVAASDKFSLSVSDFAPADAFNTDGITVTFQVIVSDQFGNPVDDGSEVNFVSPESGQIEPQCTVTDGSCSVTWTSSDPRPADGRVSILAYILRGSEEFGDKNGNFVFDVADDNDFVDLGEVCLDENESGTCEPELNEFFVDFNENNILDGGDGVWNGPCYSDYVNAAICNTPESTVIGESTVITLSTNTPVIVDMGNFPAFNVPIDLNSGDVVTLSGMVISDSNGNPLPTGTRISFADTSGGGDAFTFVGPTRVEVDDRYPTGPFGVSLITNGIATAGFGELTLFITTPDGVSATYSWRTDDSGV